MQGMKAWPVSERPREKLLCRGAESLSDAELIAVLLGTGQNGRCALTLAHELLSVHGSLSNIVTAPLASFSQTHGIGPYRYAQIQAAFEMIRRHLETPLKRLDVMSNADDAKRFLCAKLRDEQSEKFGLLMLDSQHQLITWRVMFTGTINSAAVYPRELVKQVLADNAAAVILFHNHPSGIAEPSQSDIQLTQDIKASMALIDVTVLDHIIVAGIRTSSLAQQGQMR